MAFDPTAHLIHLKGKPYLPAQARVLWFRDECPITDGWGIRTERIAGGREEKYSTYKATITDAEGRVLATATKTEDVQGFADWDEKAETGSIGRALALCGYGTQFATELDEGDRVVDSPRSAGSPRTPGYDTAGDGRAQENTSHACTDCAVALTPAQVTFSARQFGTPVCPACQAKRKAAGPEKERGSEGATPNTQHPTPNTQPVDAAVPAVSVNEAGARRRWDLFAGVCVRFKDAKLISELPPPVTDAFTAEQCDGHRHRMMAQVAQQVQATLGVNPDVKLSDDVRALIDKLFASVAAVDLATA